MYLLAFKPSIPQLAAGPTSSSATILVSFRTRSVSSVFLHRNLKHKGRFALRVHAYNSSKNDSSNAYGDSLSKSRREILLEYVENVQPEFMELFVKRAPQQVVVAMGQTVTNMIGTLPPQFFAVTVTTLKILLSS